MFERFFESIAVLTPSLPTMRTDLTTREQVNSHSGRALERCPLW